MPCGLRRQQAAAAQPDTGAAARATQQRLWIGKVKKERSLVH